MFSKASLLIVATIAAFVAAIPTPGGAGQCNTGPVQCCQEVHQSQSSEASFFASLVGVDIKDITGSVGVQCSPITAIGLGSGAKCTQQPVCCNDNHYEGLVVVGCSPVNL